MGNSEVESTGMRPKMGQRNIILPITFDYSGGRGAKKGSQKIWSIVLIVIAIIFGIGIIFRKNGLFVLNVAIGLIVAYCIIFIVRFFILKEGNVRNELLAIEKSDYKKDYKSIWGIYEINNTYPYICRFRNGKSGVIVRLNKDVILGKYSESEFEHYEAISDAYNISGGSKIQICHVDYMDNVGMDERLDESFASLGDVENEDIKDLLTDIFTYQKQQMLQRLTEFDVYTFLWTGSDISAWSTVQQILSCLMSANFKSYQVLDESGLRELNESIFNLMDFSVVNAMLGAFDTDSSSAIGVSPIKLIKANGEEVVIQKTREEKLKEAREEEKRQELRKSMGKSKKESTVIEGINLDEEIDL